MNIPILKYLDVLIGLSLIMLIVATVALSLSQALLKSVDARARYLTHGLKRVLLQLNPQFLKDHADPLTELVLLHPSVCQVRSPGMRVIHWVLERLPMTRDWVSKFPALRGEVLLREELAVCLLSIASGDGVWDLEWTEDRTKAKDALITALKERGIEDPVATLRAFRLQAMQNERAHPEQSAQRWRSDALAQVAPSEFMATLFQSFDTAMARATANFGSEAQVWVTLTAFAIVAVLQLDTFALVRRLSVDDAYRQTLVAEAQRLEEDQRLQTGQTPAPAQPVDGTCPEPTAGGQAQDSAQTPEQQRQRLEEELQRQRCEVNRSLALLQQPALDLWPDRPLPFWQAVWKAVRTPGILVTWLLVSLGAPFWYDLIKNLLQLRSLLAQRDQKDRTERAASSPAAPPPPRPPADAETNGDMGDLAATGAQG
ncbi:MAG: hypothetical protein AB7H96_23200 [Vicinamibacterales bacterium]